MKTCKNCGKEFYDVYKSGKDGKYKHLINPKRKGLFVKVEIEICKGEVEE